MHALIGIAGVLIVAAITPGPNNLVVMRTAIQGGVRGTLPAIAGVVAGGLVLLALVTIGTGSAFAARPWLQWVIGAGGCAYLASLGGVLIAGSFNGNRGARLKTLPTGAAGLFGFQFLNPKGWIMVLTTVAAARGEAGVAAVFIRLVPLFVLIPTCCLLLWAVLGERLVRYQRRAVFSHWFDRGMGTLLAASALLLLIEML